MANRPPARRESWISHHRAAVHGGRGATAPRGERGVTVVLMALSLVAVLLVSTVVIDGSQAYPQRRTAQNSADSAAAAGTQALDKKKWFGGTADVRTVAATVASNNDAPLVDCWFITGQLNSDGSIQKSSVDPTCDVGDAVPADANGVRVRTAQTRSVTFRGLPGLSNDVVARATAAASVQKVTSVSSPFVICGNPDPALAPPPGTRGFDLLKTYSTGANATDFVRNADGTIDVDPVKAAKLNKSNGGKGVPLVGSEPRVPRCGLGGGSFDGKGSGESVSIPAWVGFTGGGGYDNAANEQVLTANPCPSPFPSGGVDVACDLILPIADTGDAAAGKLHVIALGVFNVTGDGTGNPKYYATYVADARQVSGGITSTGPITQSTIRVINLIQ